VTPVPASSAAPAEAAPALDPPPADPRVDALFVEFSSRVYGLARRFGFTPEEAEDGVQEVFLKVQRKIATFRGDAALSTWLYRVAVNVLRDHRRRLQRQKRVLPLRGAPDQEEPVEAGIEGDEPSPGERMERAERAALVRAALERLPDRFREVLVLRELEGLSYRDIGRILDLPQGTVESRIHRARLRLAADLKRLEGSL